ncbi:MAG: hypothetical protein Q4615_04515 [Paracoccus aminovorans]|nr:hypothetical protein [Paracoccus aminovorans]
METALVVVLVPVICGGALWLWHLARASRQGRLLIVALWGVLLAMSVVAGAPWVLVMGGATVMMGMWVYALWRWG